MKTLIICAPSRHGNAKKVATAIAGVVGADVKDPAGLPSDSLDGYGLVGFGSEIYMGKHYKSLFEFIKSIPNQAGKKAFIFSASGGGDCRKHDALKQELAWKGFTVVGEFCCKGFDASGFLILVGGIAKGRPDDKDIENAKAFAKTLLNV